MVGYLTRIDYKEKRQTNQSCPHYEINPHVATTCLPLELINIFPRSFRVFGLHLRFWELPADTSNKQLWDCLFKIDVLQQEKEC
jgi:hypothetical protein